MPTLRQTLEVLLGTPLRMVAVLVLAVVLRRLLHRFIDRAVARVGTGDDGSSGAVPVTRRALRARTLASLLRSTTTTVVVCVAGLMLLQEVGYSIAPLLASAGVVAVAIGFGAQTLVKDVLAGIFMIVEDQYGVGDVIDIGNEVSGVVEAVGLRITRLRDVNGTVWFVRNGEILRLGNQSQGWARAVVDVELPLGADLTRVEAVLREEAAAILADEQFRPALLEDPQVWGVESLTRDGVAVRVVVRTQPLQQWPVARELRRRITTRLQADGVLQ